ALVGRHPQLLTAFRTANHLRPGSRTFFPVFRGVGRRFLVGPPLPHNMFGKLECDFALAPRTAQGQNSTPFDRHWHFLAAFRTRNYNPPLPAVSPYLLLPAFFPPNPGRKQLTYFLKSTPAGQKICEDLVLPTSMRDVQEFAYLAPPPRKPNNVLVRYP